ncbi:putative polysaccharide deacetylase family protein [Phaeoacremonium minimum UCRPA7]|uniref:Putative polysaccharide deacetylase family protein n=1 Tax=Phaeoacremonium minimum (strain UCR-PA7) TaxID=1286976 RepID=R8BIF2_PHAM7|nr:putative polysaccharide deacetylase family protein [Phaeoacremonium minimum UCRPA7]EON99091.1 putative polysaccharide deacetylase family protein [Phaeoacremonium minimum UCRPA7]
MSADKYTEEWLEREFVGYGMEQPNPEWPGGAKVCVSFVVQYYMGAVSVHLLSSGKLDDSQKLTDRMKELSVLNGDEKTCADLLEIPKAMPSQGRNEGAEQMYEYGAREGVPRLLNLFKKYNLPVTWNFYTRAIERNPFWVKPILESGAELSLGGYRWRDNLHDNVKPEVEDEEIQKSFDILQKAAEDKHLPQADWATYLKDTFDCFYEEGEAGEPKMMTIVLHPHICGRPNRAIHLENFIKYAQAKGTWFARRIDIANHWQTKFPFDAKTAFGQTSVPECGKIPA